MEPAGERKRETSRTFVTKIFKVLSMLHLTTESLNYGVRMSRGNEDDVEGNGCGNSMAASIGKD